MALITGNLEYCVHFLILEFELDKDRPKGFGVQSNSYNSFLDQLQPISSREWFRQSIIQQWFAVESMKNWYVGKLWLFMSHITLGGLYARSLCLTVLDTRSSEPVTPFLKKVP